MSREIAVRFHMINYSDNTIPKPFEDVELLSCHLMKLTYKLNCLLRISTIDKFNKNAQCSIIKYQ